MQMSEVLQMSSSKFYRTDRQTNKQTRSIVESGPPTKNTKKDYDKQNNEIKERTHVIQKQ